MVLFSHLANLNQDQRKSMSGFFVDIAKGLFLAVFGFASADLNWIIKLITSMSSMLLVVVFLDYGMSLLKNR